MQKAEIHGLDDITIKWVCDVNDSRMQMEVELEKVMCHKTTPCSILNQELR